MRMEGVELEMLAAQVGTPYYSYSAASLSARRTIQQMLGDEEMTPWQADTEEWRSVPSKA